jgi:hypothetical protein
MKKSEMIDIISKEIKKATGHEYSDVIASALLQKIEEAGMLPPPSSTEAMHNALTYAWYDFDGVDCEEDLYWEPEVKKTCGFCESPCNNDFCPVKEGYDD